MRNTWLIYFYRYIIYPLFYLILRSLKSLHPKIERYFEVRKGTYWKKFPQEVKPIWIHCSSGEFEYAKAFIRYIKKEKPEEKVLVTYFSPSVEGNLKKFSPLDFYLPAPFDRKDDMKAFIKHIQPKKLYIARTDIWPEMIYQAKKANILTCLFSATLSDKNKKISTPVHRFLFSSFLSWLDHIFCVDEEDQKNFQVLGVKNPIVTGDSRYVQVLHRLKETSSLAWPQAQKPFIVFGSTWPEDEKEILPAIKALQELGYNCIIAPHEVDSAHLKALKQTMKEENLKYSFLSKTNDPLNERLLIIDRIGLLANLYPFSDIAFIGGSFRKNVHSVMEALAAGSYVLVGPKNENNREAQKFKNLAIGEIPAVQEVHGTIDICETVDKIKKIGLSTAKEEIQKEVNKEADKALSLFPKIFSI